MSAQAYDASTLGALALVAAPAPAMAAQPIEWVFSGGSGGVQAARRR